MAESGNGPDSRKFSEGLLRMSVRGIKAHKSGDKDTAEHVLGHLERVAQVHANHNSVLLVNDPKCKWGE